MISAMLVICSAMTLAAPADYAARVETVGRYAARLELDVVPPALEAEKAARLKALQEKIAAGAQDDASFKALYMAFDETRAWLLKNAQDKPKRAEGEFSDTETAWRVKAPELTLTWDKKDFSMTVERSAGPGWKFLPCDNHDVEWKRDRFSLTAAKRREAKEFFTGYGAGMTITLGDFDAVPGLEFRITALLIGTEIVFDIAAKEPGPGMNMVKWPKPVETFDSINGYAVIPRMQGMLLPDDWSGAIEAEDLCNSRSFYMPWWGQVLNHRGVQAILETSADAGGWYRHPKGGPTRIGPCWYPTMGSFGYLRTIRYVFSDNATHVTMAKRYRQYVVDHGDFVSLKQKLVRTPALDEVIGRPVVHVGTLYHFVPEAGLFNKEKVESNYQLETYDEILASLEKLRSKGIDTAYVHLDGWGYYGYDDGHPDVVPVGMEQGGLEGLKKVANRCAEMGYFFAVHDQYRDFYLNAASFDDRLAATHVDGTRDETSTWCGGPQTILSPRFAAEYVRRNHDWFASHDVRVRGAYLDVFSVVPLEESNQPTQPVTRAQCAEYRRDCFDVLLARGYVVSSEEPTDYLAKTIEMVHHGPYPTLPNIGGGDACGIPIPLFNLVYHDSLMTPWDMGEDGGWGIPKGDAGRIHCVLNAGMPYVGPGADEKAVAHTKEAAELQKRLAFAEMTNHEFLDTTRRQQRSTYSDGTTVTVDFNAKSYEIKYPEK